MWTDEKSRRFDALRRREAQGALTDAEQDELAVLHAELDATEAAALAPAMEQLARETEALRSEKATVEDEVRELERIVAEQEGLLADARAYAERLRRRRTALAEDFRRAAGRRAQPAR
jgi:hypothetical protein